MRFQVILFSLLSLTITFSGLSADTDTPKKAIVENAIPSELSAIDHEIQLLEEELHTYRSNSFKMEMHAQQYMFDSWHRFADEIRQHEDDEQHVVAIKERLAKLYAQKAAMESAPHPQ